MLFPLAARRLHTTRSDQPHDERNVHRQPVLLLVALAITGLLLPSPAGSLPFTATSRGTLPCAAACADEPARQPAGEPASVPASTRKLGMDLEKLGQVEPLIEQAIADRKMPGCVLVIGRREGIVWQKAYGQRSLEPERLPMTVDTVFDLASLTKPVATATSVMQLIERGKLKLDTQVAQLVPDFSVEGKQGITIQHLLTHTSGLIADNPLSDYEQGRAESLRRIYALRPVEPQVGARFIYSDVNFILLGELVRHVSDRDLHAFTQQELFQPLGMTETGFVPGEALRRRAAPTQLRDGRWLQGEVHDPRAAKLGGIAGHAGLFSTGADLARYARHLLTLAATPPAKSSTTPPAVPPSSLNDPAASTTTLPRMLSASTLDLMTKAYEVPRGIRGLGWDKQSPFSSNRAPGMSAAAYGHGGFTGTVLWIDPELDLFYVFLSNRVHPDGKGAVNPLAGQIGAIAVAALQPRG